MNALLTELGVPIVIQEFFATGELLFNYGGHFEHYDIGFHRIPTTPHLWTAGSTLTREVIIVPAAMEAIAYLTINQHRYPDLGLLSFISLGNIPSKGQLRWISNQFPKRKYTLVFGNDLLGRLTDIRVATGLKGKTVRFSNTSAGICVKFDRVLYQLGTEDITLNIFEKVSALRTGCRTVKPKLFNSFLEQLKHDAKTRNAS